MLLCDFCVRTQCLYKISFTSRCLGSEWRSEQTLGKWFPCGSAPAWTLPLSPRKLDLSCLAMFYVPELSAYFQCDISCSWALLPGPRFLHSVRVKHSRSVRVPVLLPLCHQGLGSMSVENRDCRPVCRGCIRKHVNGFPWTSLVPCIC